MLSYQHIFHAGNMADVHKHGLLSWSLEYLTRKEKPVTYIETHAGRGVYDLSSAEAVKTGEASAGIERAVRSFDDDHPYMLALNKCREMHGIHAYPGSPLVAASLLRPDDKLHLGELHPAEFSALRLAMSPYAATCHHQDGFELAYSVCPPTPRRGLLLIDPSYEVKEDYTAIPKHVNKISKAWNVGIICLWYPMLKVSKHRNMLSKLQKAYPDALRHEVSFPPAVEGHGMIGSGMFIINPPFGLREEAQKISAVFQNLG